MDSKNMQISEEEYYAKLLSDPKYSEPKFSIYRFKNTLNGKVYIGQTVVPVRKRLIQHMTFSRPWTKCHKTYFHKALNKYGLINFKFDVIEICASQEELDLREKYWISYYKSNNRNFGYNIECGGKDGRKGIALTNEHKNKLLLANIGKKHKPETIKKREDAMKSLWNNKQFYNNHIETIRNNFSERWKSACKKVYQYTLDGKYVRTWDKCEDVIYFLYKKENDNRTKVNGNLKRNIDLNNKKGKLGFSKKGYIWSFFAPQGKEEP